MENLFLENFSFFELPLRLEEIESIEIINNVKLPEQLKQFYLYANGGVLKNNEIFYENQVIDWVNTILGFQSNIISDNLIKTNCEELNIRFPNYENLFHIGVTSLGNLYIGTDKQTYGKIFLCHESNFEPKIDVFEIATSFFEFIKR